MTLEEVKEEFYEDNVEIKVENEVVNNVLKFFHKNKMMRVRLIIKSYYLKCITKSGKNKLFF